MNEKTDALQKPINIYSVDAKEVATIATQQDSPNQEAESIDFIPQSFYDSLPKLLKDACGMFKDRYERDVFLYGALSVLGGSLHNLYAFNDVDKKRVAANLIAFIIAPPANGKGALGYARKLVADIKNTFASNWKQLGSKAINMLLIPANISASGLIQVLQQNEGIGIMIESEIDTLVNANKQDWGNYSDILRNAFENESASLYRKTDKQHAEIENLKLSLAISGTPNQFKSLMFSAENGLFSRGCYYVFDNTDPSLKCYGRMGSSTDIDEEFANFAKTANDCYELLLKFDKVQVVFAESQLLKIQEVLQSENNRIVNIPELKSSVRRIFVMAMKVATILTFLQGCESGAVSEKIYCSDSALQMAIDFMVTSLKHSYKAYELLPKKNKTSLSVNQERLYFELPTEFTRAEAIAKAAEIGVTIKTIDNYLKVYKEKKMIEILAHGIFRKIE